MEENQYFEYNPPFSEPDHVNDVGTKFWILEEFADIIKRGELSINVLFSETVEDNEVLWGYLIVTEDGVLHETQDKDEIWEILETSLQQLKGETVPDE